MKVKVVPISLIRDNVVFTAAVTTVRGSLQSLQDHLSCLHPEEQHAYASYPHERRQHSYLLGRYAAKYAVAKLVPTPALATIHIDHGVFNFPVVRGIEGQNIQVSISHCANTGLSVAFPEVHPMGIDVEVVDAQNLTTAQSQLNPGEIDLVQAADVGIEKASFMLFSAKESLSKVLRTGMMLDFKLMRIASLNYRAHWVQITFDNFAQYQAYATVVGRQVYTLVLPAKTTIPEADLAHLLAGLSLA